MKAKLKLNKIFSSMLSIILAFSTVSIPQNLILASQLADIEIVGDTENEENSGNIDIDISSEEDSEDISEDISSEEDSEGISEDTSSEEDSEDISEDISSEEDSEDISEDISSEEDSENVSENTSEDISNQENINKIENEIKDETEKYSNNDDILNGIIVQDGVITGYNGSSTFIGELELPREIKGSVVTAIADNAFINKGITKLTFADNSEIIKIGDNAFENNPITEVTLSPSVKIIGNYSFYKCRNMTILNASNITDIGHYAFSRCESLTSIDLSNVTSIGNSAFSGCSSLTNVDLSNVTGLGNIAFGGTGLISVDIPKITYLDSSTFESCEKLTSVNIPEVETILSSAFSGCSSLTNVNMPKAQYLRDNVFSGCSSLTNVDLSNVIFIDSDAFSGCSSLTNVNLSNVTNIGYDAFYNCYNLTSIDLQNIDYISEMAFSACSNLTSIRIPNKIKNDVQGKENSPWGADNAIIYYKDTEINGDFVIDSGYSLQKYTGSDENVTLPDGVTEIGSRAFYYNANLKNIDLSNVTKIYDYAFYGSGITSVNIPKVTEINNNVFENCSNLTSINMPKVTTIGSSAFRDCKKLTNIDFSNIIKIRPNAFENCESLTNIDLPNVENIEEGAFSNCTNVTNVNLTSKNITQMGYGIFPNWCIVNMPNYTKEEIINNIDGGHMYPWGAKYVLYKGINIDSTNNFIFTNDGAIELYIGSEEEITIPEYLESKNTKIREKIIHIEDDAFRNTKVTKVNMPYITSIGTNAFANTKLTSLELPNVVSLGIGVFSGNEDLVTVDMPKITILPSGSFERCSNLTSVNIPNITEIGEYGFQSCSKLKSINISKVTTIGSNAFSYCNNLTSINMPNVTEIGSNAFSYCSNLTSINMPNVTEISSYAFSYCDNLKSIDLSNVTKIGDNAFNNCTSLAIINIPETTKFIGDNAFLGTTNLKAIYIEQYSDDGVIPRGQDFSVPVFYLGQFIKIDPNVTRIDGNNFNINVTYNGYGEVLTKIEATDKGSETQNLNDKAIRDYKYNIPNLTTLADTEYIFTGSGKFENNHLNNLPTTFSKSTYITGFVNYIDKNGKHLSDIPADTKRYAQGEKVELTNIQPEDYGFLGWSLKPNGTKNDIVTEVYMNDKNVNLYPVFDKSAVKATLTLDYGYPQDKPIVKTISTYVGAKYNLPTTKNDNDLNRKGYKFINWDNGTNQNFTNVIEIKDPVTTLYANWEQKDITINYHLKGGKIEGVNVSDDKFTETVKFEQDYTLKTVKRNGYRFDGWYKEDTFKTQVTNLWNSVEDSGENKLTIDLYAKWTKKQEPTTDGGGEETTVESSTESTSQTISESSTESTSQTISESSTESTSQTISESSTESTSQTISESSTESTSQTVPDGSDTESTNESTSVDNQTETTTNDNQVTPPIIDGGGNNDNNGGNNNEVNNNIEQNVNVQTPDNVYTFGNLQVITPEYEELARQAIQNIVPDREAIDISIDNMLENAFNNGAQINERRLTEKPAFGFGAEGNISLLIILLLILILIITAYIIKKQIIDKEKNKDDDKDEYDNTSL